LASSGGVDDGAERVDLGEEEPLRVAEHGGPLVEDAKAVGVGEVVLDAGADEGGEGVDAGLGVDDGAAEGLDLAAQDLDREGAHDSSRERK
jgi:hypothetical protein